MDIGVYFAYWEQKWDVDYVPYVKKVADLGFDILEVGAAGIVNMSDQELKTLKNEAEKYNIRLTAGLGLPEKYDVSSENEEIRKNGIAFMKKVLDKLDKANIRKIGGIIYSHWPVDYSKPVDKPKTRSIAIKSIRELADYANQYNIMLLMETVNRFEQFLVNDADEAIAFVDAINKDNVKVMLDTFHMNIEEDNIANAIRKTGSKLGHLHIGEANRKVPGKGHISWEEIGSALRDIDFQDDVVMEPFVKPGGKVGLDIRVWRDLSNQGEEADLDKDIKESLAYVRSVF
ncbi:sugar phosphate isomerase/epimerase family protein [Oceanobacillus sp. CFH 90083]|uniref:D-psicose 3-epimerase n=1 Tax=Oceanobacillus sp. CFH 90083 TaxID=2592336 RepID=UPI00128C6F6A|nr:sugar phosphate isomerase/epimerase family protein [Oceanobacillus sp. CFH 90083]